MIPTTVVQLIDKQINLPQDHQLWTTLEGENPGGSIKDRMVLPELLQLKKSGIDNISEISAGSTALSIAFYAQKYDLKCQLFVPFDIDEGLKKKLVQNGAYLTECIPSEAYQKYENFCQSSNTWRFNQMQRKDLRLHYQKWAEEQLAPALPKLDFVIGAVGTGHSLLGIKIALTPKFGCVVAEPRPGEAVYGIRNLSQQSFGPDDPCELSLIEHRHELEKTQYFSSQIIESNHGTIAISDSFRLTLGVAISFLNKIKTPAKVLIVGSHCKFTEK